jgi:NitT/TauT family transport system permease protein
MTTPEGVPWAGRLARFVVARRRWLWAAWAIVAALLLPHAREAKARLEVAARVRGSESETVAQLLADRFDSPFARSAIVVVSGIPGPHTPDGRAALRTLAEAAGGVPGVTRTLSYLDVPDSAFVGAGTGTFMIVGLDGRVSGDSLVARLRAGTSAAALAIRAVHPAAEIVVTGEDALNHDLRAASAHDVSAAERRALPLTLALLLLAFGAVAAAVIPLGVGGLAIGLALGAHRLSGEVAEPILVALYSIPKITLYPVILLLFGLGISAKIAFGVIHGIIPVAIFTMNAVRSLRGVYFRAAKAMRLSPLQTAATIIIPATIPEIVSGFRLGFALTLLGTLIGEMFASQRGIGYMLVKAMETNDVLTVMALALLLITLATIASAILLSLDRKLHKRALPT